MKYGMEIQLFNIISISVQENDPSFQRLKEAKDAAAKIKIIGRDDYRMTRSFDVLEKAAENENIPTLNIGELDDCKFLLENTKYSSDNINSVKTVTLKFENGVNYKPEKEEHGICKCR